MVEVAALGSAGDAGSRAQAVLEQERPGPEASTDCVPPLPRIPRLGVTGVAFGATCVAHHQEHERPCSKWTAQSSRPRKGHLTPSSPSEGSPGCRGTRHAGPQSPSTQRLACLQGGRAHYCPGSPFLWGSVSSMGKSFLELVLGPRASRGGELTS